MRLEKFNSTALKWEFKRRFIWFFAWRFMEWRCRLFDLKTLVKDVEDLSECDTNPLNMHSLFLILFTSFQWHNTAKHTQKPCRYTDAHTVPASLSSLGRLHCFTADCEDCTKWSWWSLYFPSQLTNQFHILFSPTPLPPPLSLHLSS